MNDRYRLAVRWLTRGLVAAACAAAPWGLGACSAIQEIPGEAHYATGAVAEWVTRDIAGARPPEY